MISPRVLLHQTHYDVEFYSRRLQDYQKQIHIYQLLLSKELDRWLPHEIEQYQDHDYLRQQLRIAFNEELFTSRKIVDILQICLQQLSSQTEEGTAPVNSTVETISNLYSRREEAPAKPSLQPTSKDFAFYSSQHHISRIISEDTSAGLPSNTNTEGKQQWIEHDKTSPRSANSPQEEKHKRNYCKEPNCTKHPQVRGYCAKHGTRSRCSFPTCTSLVKRRGLCRRHCGYTVCKVEGCKKQRMKGGLCSMHGKSNVNAQ